MLPQASLLFEIASLLPEIYAPIRPQMSEVGVKFYTVQKLGHPVYSSVRTIPNMTWGPFMDRDHIPSQRHHRYKKGFVFSRYL